MRDYDVAVIGLGFTGLATAVSAATAGFRVLGVDSSASRLTEIAEVVPGCGRTTTSETSLATVLRDGRLDVRPRAAAARVHVVCVSTPSGPDHGGDLRPLSAAAGQIGTLLRRGDLVLIQSTCPPGAVLDHMVPLLARRSGLTPGCDFHLAYSPVRLDPGADAHASEQIPRVVAGLRDDCTAAATEFLSRCADRVVPVSSIAAAELVKVFENTFRLVNISLVNELAQLCRAMDVDVHEVIDAARTKPFGFLAHRPGPGAGGDCVPVAPRFLAHAAQRHGVAVPVVAAAMTVNDRMPDLVIDRVATLLAGRHLPNLWDSRVLVVGVTYKPDLPNIRGSAAIRMIERLHARTRVGYSDPYVPHVRLADGTLLRHEPPNPDRADLVLLVTKHRAVDHVALHDAVAPVVDCSDGLARLMNSRLADSFSVAE